MLAWTSIWICDSYSSCDDIDSLVQLPSLSGMRVQACTFPLKTLTLLSDCLCWVTFHTSVSAPWRFSRIFTASPCPWSDQRPSMLQVCGEVAAAALAGAERTPGLNFVAADTNIHPVKCCLLWVFWSNLILWGKIYIFFPVLAFNIKFFKKYFILLLKNFL